MVSGWFEAIEDYLEYFFAVMAPELSTFHLYSGFGWRARWMGVFF